LNKRALVGLLIGFLTLFLTACSSPAAEPVTLKVGVLPILDALPMHVAEAEGFFEEAGIIVELVPVSSGPERDQLMQAGQIDGMINELVSTLFYNQEETQIQIVRFARVATESSPVFRILAAADSGIESVADLANIPIGISEGTVIEYTTDRMLINAGLSSAEIAKVAIPRIPDRFALLQSGELLAANLPDPLASLAIQGGATLIIDDTSYPEISSSVISFSKTSIDENPQAIRAFLSALEQAVNEINSDKARWSDLLTELQLVPPPLLGSYTIPDYPGASVPSSSQFDDALDWAMEKGLVGKDVPFESSVTSEFLP
jgi:NitT/TauT family transport system substrate-binding protein